MSIEQGVPMICATSVMKPGRARIGKIAGGFTLPRTVPIVNLVAAAIGALIGLAIALSIGSGSNSVLLGAGFGAGAGWMSVTYSPLKNESLLKWFELKVKSQTRMRYINGRRVTLAVGTAVVSGPSSGEVLMLRSAVRVPAGQYDERGAVRSARNGNLGARSADPALRAATAQSAGSLLLPTDEPPAVTRRSQRSSRTQPRAAVCVTPLPPVDDPLAGRSQTLKD